MMKEDFRSKIRDAKIKYHTKMAKLMGKLASKCERKSSQHYSDAYWYKYTRDKKYKNVIKN